MSQFILENFLILLVVTSFPTPAAIPHSENSDFEGSI